MQSEGTRTKRRQLPSRLIFADTTSSGKTTKSSYL
jgi:hypothetical protein